MWRVRPACAVCGKYLEAIEATKRTKVTKSKRPLKDNFSGRLV
jgi:hypothetical protein